MLHNPLFLSDSYKDSHWRFYPPNTTGLFSYIESRGGKYGKLVFFGLQGFIQEYLRQPITMLDVQEKIAFNAIHGVPVDEKGLQRIVEVHNGYWPVRIKAVQEGSITPLGRAIVTVESTDPELPWVASYIETMLLRAIWYPTTIASKAYFIRQKIEKLWKQYADSSANPDFAFLDFSSRGCSSVETNAIGGAAFLTSFSGSDSIPGIIYARDFYGAEMAGFSVPATEHSVMTSYGRGNELASFKHLIDITPYGKTISVVSDTWDIYQACHLWGELASEIIRKDITLVIRPDSGMPKVVLPKIVSILKEYFTYYINDKGFAVFDKIKLLWGDGINEGSFEEILIDFIELTGFGPENLMLGSGGGLLQNVTRDDMKFAMKASAVQIGGREWKAIYKDPITDPGKKSKKGRLMLIKSKEDGSVQTVDESLADQLGIPLLETVWENGKDIRWQSFDNIKALIRTY